MAVRVLHSGGGGSTTVAADSTHANDERLLQVHTACPHFSNFAFATCAKADVHTSHVVPGLAF